MSVDMEIVNDKPMEIWPCDSDMVPLPDMAQGADEGTTFEYCCHLPGGNIRIRYPDCKEYFVAPVGAFPTLR